MRRFLLNLLGWLFGVDQQQDVEKGPVNLDRSLVTVEVRVPKLGSDFFEAEVVRWVEVQGAEIEEGQPICEMETELFAFEVPSPASGTVVQILVLPGESVKVGSILGRIATEKS